MRIDRFEGSLKNALMHLTTESKIENKILKIIEEFTNTSEMESITTGMLALLTKAKVSTNDFVEILDHLEERGLIIGVKKGRTKKWRLS